LAGATVDSVRAGSAGRLTSALAEVAELERSDEFGSFLTNHDQERVASALDGDEASLRLAATLLLTGPGAPFVYYGEEIGMLGEKPDERIGRRCNGRDQPAAGFSTAAPWQPLSDGWPAINAAAQRDDPGSLRSLYRDLIALRDEHAALRRLLVPVTVDAGSVVATLRGTPDETLLVLANLADGRSRTTRSSSTRGRCAGLRQRWCSATAPRSPTSVTPRGPRRLSSTTTGAASIVMIALKP
jgi:glycosidase